MLQEARMTITTKPVITQWYRHLDKGYEFQVTAIDDRDKTVEIQYFDGDLDEVELNDWYHLQIEPIEAPEDWTGPVDDIERDDLGYTGTGMDNENWARPMEEEGESHEEKEPGNAGLKSGNP